MSSFGFDDAMNMSMTSFKLDSISQIGIESEPNEFDLGAIKYELKARETKIKELQ